MYYVQHLSRELLAEKSDTSKFLLAGRNRMKNGPSFFTFCTSHDALGDGEYLLHEAREREREEESVKALAANISTPIDVQELSIVQRSRRHWRRITFGLKTCPARHHASTDRDNRG